MNEVTNRDLKREDIERMTVEAGGGTPEWDGIWELNGDALERLAGLFAAHEREACAKVCDARVIGDHNREDQEAKRCAEAIRARGEE